MPSMIEPLQEIVRAASENKTPLRIAGGDTRGFLGEALAPEMPVLSMSAHSGVISYHPEELMLRVRAGTRLAEINHLLSEQGQMLAFEPPIFDAASTIGGTVATALSGPRRPYAGAVRDAVLGVGLILNDGTYAEFGGQVMKNVAGYDVSRLVCGAFGMLGPVADISFKVLPRPEKEITVALQMPIEEAQQICLQLTRHVSGLSATFYEAGQLTLRFSGTEQLVDKAVSDLGASLPMIGSPMGEDSDEDFWVAAGNLSGASFQKASEVWRLSTRPDEPVSTSECQIYDWGFGQRWLLNPAHDPRENYQGSGHWTRFRSTNPNPDQPVFQPLPLAHLQLTRNLKAAFDPDGLFNPGRMYPGI